MPYLILLPYYTTNTLLSYQNPTPLLIPQYLTLLHHHLIHHQNTVNKSDYVGVADALVRMGATTDDVDIKKFGK